MTTRIPALDPAATTGKTRTLLDAVQKKLGVTPNLTRTLAHAPAALDGYLQFSGALAQGTLPASVREQIALVTAEANLCDYCLSAHTAIGGKLGLSAADIDQARHAKAGDAKVDAILKLARSIVVNRGEVPDVDLAAARRAGVTDGELVETTAHVALNVLTNYVNHVARTDIDFPRVASAGATAGTDDACATGACPTR